MRYTCPRRLGRFLGTSILNNVSDTVPIDVHRILKLSHAALTRVSVCAIFMFADSNESLVTCNMPQKCGEYANQYTHTHKRMRTLP